MKAKPCRAKILSEENTGKNGNSSYGDFIIDIGRLFIDKPYKANTLESPGKEKLIVHIAAFDCTNFVETVLALARCAVTEKFSRDAFRKNLQFIRYRQGKIDGYSSRLHYFMDWLHDNEKKQILRNIAYLSGGIKQHKKINFMTTHRELYPALENKSQFSKMAVVERNLSRRDFYAIDSDNLGSQLKNIKNGDIIAFTTEQAGLDVAHTGFAIRNGKSLHLLHASQKEDKVVISKKTLAAYLKSNKKFTGILLARPLC